MMRIWKGLQCVAISHGQMASLPMKNIETFSSQQMYRYLSLVERKVTEFYHNIDRRRYLVWF